VKFQAIAADVVLGEGVKLAEFVNLYGCSIGADTKIGTFVEVQRDAVIGKRCKISSHTFICSGVEIGDGVFVGHGVMFTNDRDPRAVNADGTLKVGGDWELVKTRIEDGASIGSGAIILPGVTIGKGALVGAGAVVTHDVAPGATVIGVPARVLERRR
jgi:UDP-2-acetamido-3-amino-2,3-dideoxy-glucuronate N-acetyltransferase